MRHESSYKENMRKSAVELRRKDNAFMLDVFSQMVIDESIYKLKREKLVALIDEALDSRDEELFYTLSKQYKEMLDYFYK